MLNPVELPRYLIARGLLSPEAVVSGDLLIRDMSSRNRDYAVDVRRTPSLFVKQALDPDDRYLRMEARRYTQLAPLLPSVMPRLVLWDEELALLVVELVGDGDVHSTQAAASGQDRCTGRLTSSDSRPWRSLSPSTICTRPCCGSWDWITRS